MQKKVLLVTQYLGFGGLERMILNLAVGLKEQGWTPVVFVYDTAPGADHNTLKPLLREKQIRVVETSKGPGFSFRVLFRLVRIIWKERPTAIHSHDIGALIYSALAKIFSLKNPRLVHTQHSLTHHSLHPRYVLYDRIFFRIADRVALVSPHLAQLYEKLGVPGRLFTTISNGVDFLGSPAASNQPLILRRQQLLKRDCPDASRAIRTDLQWILYLARLHPGKGQEHALRAWGHLDAKVRSRCQLLVIGAETYPNVSKKLSEQIQKLPDAENVHLLGPTQFPLDWLGVADLYLSCSEHEGMPLGPIEAAGSGVTTVLSDIPGHQLLKNLATLVPYQHPETVAQAITEGLKLGNGEPTGPNSKNWASGEELRNHYSIFSMSRAYEKLYG